MSELLNKWVEAVQSATVLVVGLAWAGGAYASAPLLNLFPAIVHTALGWAFAVLGAIGIFIKFTKK